MAPLRQEEYYYDDYEEVAPKRAPKIVEDKDKKIQKKKAKKIKTNKKNIVLGVSIFGVALSIVVRYAMINNMSVENIRLKKELDTINNTNAQLKLVAEKQVDLNQIEEYAKNNLGLQKPQNYQIEYIDVDKTDLIKNKAINENKKGIKEIILSIAEFFN